MDRSFKMRQYSSAYRYAEHEDRDWRQAYVSQPQRKQMVKSQSRWVVLRRYALTIFIVVVVIIAIIACIIYFNKRDPSVTRLCPPGFNGDRCERSDFLGSQVWYADDFYTLDDGFQYRNGIAFRIYAPSAKSVVVHCVSFSGSSSSFSMM